MRTFLMIYNKYTKELIDDHEESNDPQTAFNNWFLESTITFDLFQDVIAFYFIGSVNIDDRKSGHIIYNNDKQQLDFIDYPLYFKFYEKGSNFICYRYQKIYWDDKNNFYLIAPDNMNEIDTDDLADYLLPIDVVIPSMDGFFEVEIEYHYYISQKEKPLCKVDARHIKHKRFYKKCKICDNTIVLKIDEMLEGKKVNCTKCKFSKKLATKKVN